MVDALVHHLEELEKNKMEKQKEKRM